jgi:pimeloyl-ACP methyl ester carboxylesterase
LPVLPLNVETWGAGARRALVIHGASSSAEVWWRLGPDLAALGFTVVAPDLRGHGHSPDDGDWSLPAYRDDLLALGTGWDLVVGHSLGGLLAVAAQRAQPAFARSLVLEDPALRFEVTPEFLAWLVQDFAAPMTVAEMARSRPNWDRRDVETKVRSLHAVGAEAIRATFDAFGDTDVWRTLADLGVPGLVIGADPACDAMVTDADIAAAAAIPGIDAIMIPGSSHSIHRDSYEPFWQAISSFVNQHVA